MKNVLRFMFNNNHEMFHELFISFHFISFLFISIHVRNLTFLAKKKDKLATDISPTIMKKISGFERTNAII